MDLKRLNKTGIALLTAMFLLCGPLVPSLGAASLEYQVKAAFLYKFIKFIEWPAEKFSSEQEPLTIGVLGDSPILSSLEAFSGKEAGGRKLKIVSLSDANRLGGVHVVFISPSEKRPLQKILSSLKDKSILTVSESPDFGSLGGMLNFYIEKEKVRFEINPEAAQASGINISSKILRLAKIVHTQ